MRLDEATTDEEAEPGAWDPGLADVPGAVERLGHERSV
jgi:hypothetical protein